jgi:hypothetical protein
VAAGTIQTNNAQVVAVLMDLDLVPNTNHVKNPNKTKYLNASMVGDFVSAGVSKDGVYRDPWGNPYIISLDLNYDDKTRDSFYRLKTVSEDPAAAGKGLNGLILNPNAGADGFEVNDKIMIWSAGPDKMIDPNTKATQGVNRDNILSWKP